MNLNRKPGANWRLALPQARRFRVRGGSGCGAQARLRGVAVARLERLWSAWVGGKPNSARPRRLPRQGRSQIGRTENAPRANMKLHGRGQLRLYRNGPNPARQIRSCAFAWDRANLAEATSALLAEVMLAGSVLRVSPSWSHRAIEAGLTQAQRVWAVEESRCVRLRAEAPLRGCGKGPWCAMGG